MNPARERRFQRHFRPPLGGGFALLLGLLVANPAAAQSNYATPYTFTTLAGFAGSTGTANGSGSGARFNHPYGVATDGAGTIYVADTSNHTIRKITPSGAVTTLAGLAESLGSADGTSAARFFFPQGAAADFAGNVYVADTDNSTIRKVALTGVVTTLAGLALNFGSADGSGASARFNYTFGVAVDSFGSVFVADNHNDTIRKITSTGVVTTLAGLAGNAGSVDGLGGSARFLSPKKVAIDAAGNVYVADDGAIRKISSAGLVTTLAGSVGVSGSVDGTGGNARFFGPAAVAVDSAGNIFVAESLGNTVRKITSAGVVTTLAGFSGVAGSADGTGSAVRFDGPQGIAVDSAGNLYVADTNNSTIRVGSLPVNLPPSIVAQPASVTAVIGANVAFSVSASGAAPLSYQWKKNATAIFGATSATLALTNVQSGDAANYTVVVTNGIGTVTSNAATLAIGPPVSGTIDFDSLNAQAANVFGTTVANYLGLSGITVSGLTAGTQLAVIDDRHYNGGGSMVAASGHNILSQTGLNTAVSYTLNFPQPLSAFAFTRAKLIPPLSSGGVIHPQWSATALDAGGHVLGSVSEAFTDSLIIVAAKAFSLSFTGIAAVRFDANVFGAAGPSAALLDDFVLSYPLAAPAITAQPASQSSQVGAAATLSVTATSNPAPAYQWRLNGTALAGATAALTIANVQPANAGIYTALVTTSAGGTTTSDPAILAVTTTGKVVGAAEEVAQDIAAGLNTYDQVLLEGAAATVTADAGQITRTSFIDLSDDIVQVEFGGAGALSVVLDNPSGPAAPLNYNQAVSYMKGHAGIVITGANETTNVAVFSVGTLTARNQSLFRSGVLYDGVADIAFIAILSPNGKFGGVRTANASYLAAKGFTGLYAPGVQFTGPVYVGDIVASDAATPVLLLGSAGETRITGGSLFQINFQPVKVSGIAQLKFTSGTTSHNVPQAAQMNRGQLVQNGVDVTAQIVVNPQ